jgi:RecA/RadA recombinase
MSQTVVVNMFGGPGAGKTTAAFEVMAKLKKAGFVAEYAPEYAKELVWTISDPKEAPEQKKWATELINGTVGHQTMLYLEQNRRVRRLIGQCDFVVTDSPALLGCMYLQRGIDPREAEFDTRALKDYRAQSNFNFFVQRSGDYEQDGRVHTEEQATAIDKEIIAFAESKGIYMDTYNHEQIDLAISNMIKTHARINAYQAPTDPIETATAEAPSLGKIQGKEQAMAEETKIWDGTSITLPKTGYKGRESLHEYTDKQDRAMAAIKLPPKMPEMKDINGETVDISNHTVFVPSAAVKAFDNDPGYYNVSFPNKNKNGEDWHIDAVLEQGHYANPDGKTKEEKGAWVAEETLRTTVTPMELKESSETLRSERAAYAREKEAQEQVQQQTQTKTKKSTPTARRAAKTSSPAKDGEAAKKSAQAQSKSARANEHVKTKQ